MAHPAPLTPDALRLAHAIDRSAPMVRLQAMLRATQARFDAIRPALPPGMIPYVRPIPAEDAALALVADNPSVAAKLRQWLPRLEQLLVERGEPVTTIRVKLRSR